MGGVAEESISAPVRLDDSHERPGFDCGTPSLNDWLKSRALRNERTAVSRTYVVCAGSAVVGYYSLSSTEVLRDEVPKTVQRNTPNKIPATLLGRLAIDIRYQGRGLGKELLRDATLRTVGAGEIVGSALLVVDALSEDVVRFYSEQGFIASGTDPLRLYLPLAPLRSVLLT